MWHEERELAFQRRRGGKVLTGSSFKGRKGSRYTPHISSLFGDTAAASTFYLPPISSPFFSPLPPPFFLYSCRLFFFISTLSWERSRSAWQATFGSICSRIISGGGALAELSALLFVLTLFHCGNIAVCSARRLVCLARWDSHKVFVQSLGVFFLMSSGLLGNGNLILQCGLIQIHPWKYNLVNTN